MVKDSLRGFRCFRISDDQVSPPVFSAGGAFTLLGRRVLSTERHVAGKKFIIEQKKAQGQDHVIQECVIGCKNYADLPRGHNQK